MRSLRRSDSAVRVAHLARALRALAIGVALAACGSEGIGSNGETPTTPTKPLIPKVLSVSIVSNPGVLPIGERAQLAVSVLTVDGALAVVGWSSSNTAVASVSNGGLVTALALGVTTITATSLIDSTKSASIAITVGFRAAVNSVSIAPSSATIAVGGTQALTATVSAVGGARTDVTWGTSDQAIATVSTTGVVTGVAEGIANITARSVFDAARSSTVPVIVVGPP
jgi:uncharacterized protein YjdB